MLTSINVPASQRSCRNFYMASTRVWAVLGPLHSKSMAGNRCGDRQEILMRTNTLVQTIEYFTYRTRWVHAAVTPFLNLLLLFLFHAYFPIEHTWSSFVRTARMSNTTSPLRTSRIASDFCDRVIPSCSWFYHMKFMGNRAIHGPCVYSQRRSERLTMAANLAVLVPSRMHTTFFHIYHQFSVVFPFQHFAE